MIRELTYFIYSILVRDYRLVLPIAQSMKTVISYILSSFQLSQQIRIGKGPVLTTVTFSKVEVEDSKLFKPL